MTVLSWPLSCAGASSGLKPIWKVGNKKASGSCCSPASGSAELGHSVDRQNLSVFCFHSSTAETHRMLSSPVSCDKMTV